MSPSSVGSVLIRVLGPVIANLDDGSRFEPPSEGQRKMLALLAIRAGRPVAADTICDLFDLSAGAVRTTVSRLRKVLGDAVVTESQGYSLVTDTDVQQFQTLVASARTAAPTQASALRAEALELFGQPALDEFSDEPWALAEVTRLNELRSTVVEDLIEAYIDDARFDDAINEVHQHIIEYPYRDRPHELLMQALALSGRQVEALRAFQDYRTQLIEEVGVDPSPAIIELDRLISTGEVSARTPASGTTRVLAPAAPDRSLSNLHFPPNDFVGREAEIAEVGQAVAESRLVTLLGPGGVGKTRLSYRVAAEQSETFSDGVWVAELVGCKSGADVIRTIAGVFGLSEVDNAERCADQLSGHDLLLVLDNCENLIDELHPIIDVLLTRTGRLKLLASSRERLGVVGERTVVVSPLRTDGEAQDLFVRRATASGAAINDDDMDAVGDICRRLDGIPLALELAAASARVLSPRELLERLDDRFALLKGGQRGSVAGRHESLRAAVDSSYDSLDVFAQAFFRHIAAFAPDFPLAAAEAAAEGLDRPAIDLLSELVDRSLLTTSSTSGRSRYRMLETLRQYGLDRLNEIGELDDAAERQVNWCFEFTGKLALNGYGASEATSLNELVAASPNIRLAIDRLLNSDQLERAGDLVLQLADYTYASNTLASLVGPVIQAGVAETHPRGRELLAIELIHRATSGTTETRRELARALAEDIQVEEPGTVQLSVLLIAQALKVGPTRAFIDSVIARAEQHAGTAESARLLCAAGLGIYYGEDLPEDLMLVEAAMAAAEQAGMKRLTVAASSMACIAGVRLGRPEVGAAIAHRYLGDLAELGHASIMSNGLIAIYTDAAIQAGLPASEQLGAIRFAGPNLRGDFNRIGQALARLVQQHGHSELAIRALGACEGENRSSLSSAQRDKILERARDDLSEREVESLLAIGAVSEKTVLYREMWAVLEPMMPT